MGVFGCAGDGLRFDATTPDGPSASASAQVYQVIDYNALVPPAERATTRRVRVQAVFTTFPEDETEPDPDIDTQFGLRMDAYAGDPDAFPRTGDPETFSTETNDYSLLSNTEATLLHEGARWQPLRVELMLPEGTDFFVVLLEAYENVLNETSTREFRAFHRVDEVQIAVDAGNTPPLARPDYPRARQDTPIDIPVLSNDQDNTSRIDTASVAIAQPPASGTGTPNPDGTVTYTPDPGFLGTDTFTYTVADEEGLRSDEATVTIEVVPPVFTRFLDTFNTDPQERWRVQVRGESSGPTGIEQTVGHQTTGGNPRGFREMTHRIDGEGNLFVSHIYTAAYFLPSEQGAIVSLTYSEDRISLDGSAVGSRVLVRQGGQVHVALLPTFRDQAWTRETVEGLTAEDFTPVPDFSASADTLWFGYERANSNTSPDAVQERRHGIDNLEVEVFSAGSGTGSGRSLGAAGRD